MLSRTPITDHLRASGSWNPYWDPISALDPDWAETFIRMGISAWTNGVLPLKTVELLCIAGDASVTHMYAPGVRRHIRGALQQGAARAEIAEVLKLACAMGSQSLRLGVPILVEELGRQGASKPVSNGSGDGHRQSLHELDAAWSECHRNAVESVWRDGVLDLKTIELICICLNAACTHLSADGVRRHIRAALAAGASRAEILEVLKLTSVLGIHSLSLAAPILAEEYTACTPVDVSE